MKKYLLPFLLLTLVFYASCSSLDYTETMRVPESLFYDGNYMQAAEALLPAINQKGKNQLLFMMECGYMLHAGGDYQKSNKVLLPAAEKALVSTTSISKQAASLLTNNSALPYKGEDFEKVLIHMYLGINYFMLKDFENAVVEFKRVNEELQKIKNESDGSARYKQNIMAKYMTAKAYEAIGYANNDMDDIEFAYKELEQIYALNSNIGLVRADLQLLSKKLGYADDYAKWVWTFGKLENRPDNYGELVAILQSGRCAIKKSRGTLLTDSAMNLAINVAAQGVNLNQGITIGAVLATLAIAENPIPYFEKQSDLVKALKVTVNGQTFSTTALEDISATAIQNLEDDYTSLKSKVAVSVVLKAVAAVAAGEAAKAAANKLGSSGSLGNLLGTLLGSGTGMALFSQMQPDLRSWRTLPAKLHVGRIFLPPGTYSANLAFVGANGITDTKTVSVEIKANEITFINERTLDASAYPKQESPVSAETQASNFTKSDMQFK